MSVGITFTGSFASSGDESLAAAEMWLRDVSSYIGSICAETLIESALSKDSQGRPSLLVKLHPLSEIVIAASAGSRVGVSSLTSSLGPGYHVYLCNLIKSIEQKYGIVWDGTEGDANLKDPTGYFDTGNFDGVLLAMFRHLHGTVAHIVELREEDGGKFQIALPQALIFDHEGVIATPLGHRDLSWMERVIANPEAGTDIFPWWDTELGAEFYLKRALTMMWIDCCYRTPFNEEEEDSLRRILADLQTAYDLDPTLDFPYPEWNELLQFEGEEYELAELVEYNAAESGREPSIGYRRRDMSVLLPGGWKFDIEGLFALELLEDRETLRAFDDTREVYVTIKYFGEGEAPALNIGDGDNPDDVVEIMEKDRTAFAKFSTQLLDKNGVTELHGTTACKGEVAISTLSFLNSDDRYWAERVFRSIRK
ncbi:MAG: hypothetical protein NUW37_06295 [Planctomycetes bacterium]|nr:hypothetical protein [Planctomycetota bacterium]